MKTMRLLPAIAVSLLLPTAGALAASATADLTGANGERIGTVQMTDTKSGTLLVSAEGTNLSPGKHGFHIHETGKCDPSTGFKSAGGHLAGDNDHGIRAEDGKHPGDLPNLYVSSDGKFAFETFIADASVENEWFDKVELFDEDGTAVVIHSDPDDYMSQPAGDAGTRVACGVIKKN